MNTCALEPSSPRIQPISCISRWKRREKSWKRRKTRLRDFKLSHVGELPEQQQGNLGILTGLQAQLQSTMASLERAQQQRALLQAQLEATPRRRLLPRMDPVDSHPGERQPHAALTPVEAAQTISPSWKPPDRHCSAKATPPNTRM